MQPLHGTKIVTIAFNLPGPAAVSQLDRWGAAVVKVEPPGGDPLALHCPDFYQYLLGNQKVERLDLKHETDRGKLGTHLAGADLLVTSTLPSSLERLGLSWARVACPVSAAVPGGDRRSRAARCGADRPRPDLSGQRRPGHSAGHAADVVGRHGRAQTTVSHALAVLAERARTGEGVLSYVPIAGALEFFTLPLRYGLTVTGGPLGGGCAVLQSLPDARGLAGRGRARAAVLGLAASVARRPPGHLCRAEGPLLRPHGGRVGALGPGASPADGCRAIVPRGLIGHSPPGCCGAFGRDTITLSTSARYQPDEHEGARPGRLPAASLACASGWCVREQRRFH